MPPPRVVAASSGSDPIRAASSTIASVTVRAIGPAVSWLCAIGTMPLRLTSPSVGLMPTSELLFDGETIDPSVSVPTAAAQRFAAAAASGARTGRIAVERVRILRQPAAAAPAARRVRRSEIRPLAEVRLAEDDRARLAETPHDEGVLRRLRSGERERSGGRHHAIGGRDVVLDQDGDPVQRTARSAAPPLRVEGVGNRQRVGIRLEHAVQRRIVSIDLVDAREVFLDERSRRVPSRLHALLQIGDRGFLEVEARRSLSRQSGAGSGDARDKDEHSDRSSHARNDTCSTEVHAR